jgi:hypothetical protein
VRRFGLLPRYIPRNDWLRIDGAIERLFAHHPDE